MNISMRTQTYFHELSNFNDEDSSGKRINTHIHKLWREKTRIWGPCVGKDPKKHTHTHQLTRK